MPRKVKRVKVARGQKQKHTKKFWIIMSSIIAAVVAAVVALSICIYFFAIKEDAKYKYFKEVPSEYSVSWYQANKKREETEHMFIYYWDDEKLNPEDSTSDAELEENIVKLYKTIVRYNETMADTDNFENLDFCLVKTNVYKGKGALSDSDSGITETMQLAYYYDGKKVDHPYGVNDPSNQTAEEIEGDSGFNDFTLELSNVKDAIEFVLDLMKL